MPTHRRRRRRPPPSSRGAAFCLGEPTPVGPRPDPAPDRDRVLAALYGVAPRRLAGLVAGRPDAAVEAALGARWADRAEAWEALAARGLIPDAWVANPARLYYEGSAEFGLWPEDPGTLAEVPLTWRLLVAQASDVAAVRLAEHLAVELATRLAPWRDRRAAPATGALVWQARWRSAVDLCRALSAVTRAVTAAFGVLATQVPWGVATDSTTRGTRAYWEFAATLWRRAAAAGLATDDAPGAARGTPFAALPDPWPPARQLLCLGYTYSGTDRDGRVGLGVA